MWIFFVEDDILEDVGSGRSVTEEEINTLAVHDQSVDYDPVPNERCLRDQPSTSTGGETTTATANRPLPQADEESSQTMKPTLLATKRGKKMTKRTTQEKNDIPSSGQKRKKKDKLAEAVSFISKEKLRTLKWKKGSFQTEPSDVGSTSYVFTANTTLPEEVRYLNTPSNFFSYFVTPDFLKHIQVESARYATQNGDENFKVHEYEIKRYIGIVAFSSVVKLPNVRKYWSPSIGNSIVWDALTVRRFEEIRKWLHFNNNAEYNQEDPSRDRLFRIRPVLNHFLEKFKRIPIDEKISLDKQICPTRARIHIEQYLPAKPRKWGYKLFVLSGMDGFSHHFEIYAGHENVADDGVDLGAAGNVVRRLCSVLKNPNHKIYFDNYYMSIPLLVYLHQHNIQALGTLRRNRIPNQPLPSETEMNKRPRGSYEEFVSHLYNTPLILIAWKDSKIVNLLSTYVGSVPESTIRRLDRKIKEKIDVPCPHIVKEYNRHMGGVDLLDSHLARCRIILHSKKWYVKLFYHLLDMTL